jgi:4-hydroxy-3-methylbut-2-enyl diphosphate reductase
MEQAMHLAKYITGELQAEHFYTDFKNQYSEGFDVTKDLQRIGVVNQTTMLASETQAIADYLKQVMVQQYNPVSASERFADTRDTLCYATMDNQSAVQGMLNEQADFALVIGGYNSSNTSHLVELCEEKLPTYFIKDEHCLLSGDTIRHFDLHSHTEKETHGFLPANKEVKVMITSGASCPDALVERVIGKLAELTNNENVITAITNQWSVA